jgi:hypothetical protein
VKSAPRQNLNGRIPSILACIRFRQSYSTVQSTPNSVASAASGNVRVPTGVAPCGTVAVLLTIGNATNKPGVTMAVR